MQQNTPDQNSVYFFIHEAVTPQLINQIYKDNQPTVGLIEKIHSFIKKLINPLFGKS